MNLTPNALLAGTYRVRRCLGKGAWGEVWASTRLSDNREVAVKILLSAGAHTNEAIARFRRESQVLARVRSKYIAQVLDFLSDPDFGLVLVMDLIPGESLHTLLWRQPAVPLEAALDLAEDVARGLRDLHAVNIVHRDLKPGNIILRPRPGLRACATLIDFGVSRIISNPDEEEITAITRGDRVLGTLEYMAPEQILGSRSVTGTADLYALGAILYRAIAGQHVFESLSEGQLAVAKLNQDAPPLTTKRTDPVATRTARLVARLLSRRVHERYASADEVLAELEQIRELARQNAPEVTVEICELDEATFDGNELLEELSQAPGAEQEAPPSSARSSRRPTASENKPRKGRWIVGALLAIACVGVAFAAGLSYGRGGAVHRLLQGAVGAVPEAPAGIEPHNK